MRRSTSHLALLAALGIPHAQQATGGEHCAADSLPRRAGLRTALQAE